MYFDNFTFVQIRQRRLARLGGMTRINTTPVRNEAASTISQPAAPLAMTPMTQYMEGVSPASNNGLYGKSFLILFYSKMVCLLFKFKN